MVAKRHGQSPLAKKRRARKINRVLARGYPHARAELDFTNALELLIATVLSAQTTDVRVNQVTRELFATYPSAQDYAHADIEDIERIITPTGFYRAKAGYLVGIGTQLVENHGGEVPTAMEDLVKLPGVGRKTAHVVRGNVFGLPGITADTHVIRLSNRFELTSSKDAIQVEKDLAELIEPQEHTMFSHRVIFHGRRVCHAKSPACGACFLAPLCPSFGAGPTEPEEAEKRITSEDKEHLLSMVGQI